MDCQCRRHFVPGHTGDDVDEPGDNKPSRRCHRTSSPMWETSPGRWKTIDMTISRSSVFERYQHQLLSLFFIDFSNFFFFILSHCLCSCFLLLMYLLSAPPTLHPPSSLFFSLLLSHGVIIGCISVSRQMRCYQWHSGSFEADLLIPAFRQLSGSEPLSVHLMTDGLLFIFIFGIRTELTQPWILSPKMGSLLMWSWGILSSFQPVNEALMVPNLIWAVTPMFTSQFSSNSKDIFSLELMSQQ